MDQRDDPGERHNTYRTNYHDVPDILDGPVQVFMPVRAVRLLLLIEPVRVVLSVRLVLPVRVVGHIEVIGLIRVVMSVRVA